MNIQTKFNRFDNVWFMSYRLKKPVCAMIKSIEVTVTDKVMIRYAFEVDGIKSYFFEWQVFQHEYEVLNALT